MQTASSQFLEMLRYSHTAVSTMDLYSGTTLVRANVPISDGSIDAVRKNNVRRTLNASIALADWEDLAIDTYASRVQIWVGLEITPGIPITLSQGIFRVDDISRQRLKQMSISGSSLESYVVDDRFFTPRTPPKGSGTIASIKSLIVESIATATFKTTATQDKVVGMTAPWERERWEAITSLADSINAEVYCDPNGVFVIANKTNFVTATQVPVWSVDVGESGVLVTETESQTRDKVYNGVVASGQSSDQDIPPYWDVVTDNNPNSKTWWGGPFGHVPRFYSNPNFTTKAQCTAAATNMLAEATAENRNVDFTALPNPALERGRHRAVDPAGQHAGKSRDRLHEHPTWSGCLGSKDTRVQSRDAGWCLIMPTIAQVVRPLENRHDELRWWVGTITAINTTTHKLTVAFAGNTSTGTPYVDYVDSYTPVVGAKVHAISNENRGMLVIGSTGKPPAQVLMAGRMAAMEATVPDPDACAVPEHTGTYVQIPNGPSGFNPTLVAQGDGLLGVWNMPGLAAAIQSARELGLLVSAEIEITLTHGGPRAIMTLVRAVNPIGLGFVHRSQTLTIGEPTRVALPLGWLDPLADGSCMIGLISGNIVPLGGFETSACVYLTVEPIEV